MARSQSDPADVAVILVHGIGEQLRGATLLEWAEPLTRRLTQFARQDGGGVSTVSVSLEGPEPATAWVQVRNKHKSQTVVFTEARWASAFLAHSPDSVINWAVRFVWRASRHAARQCWRMACNFISIRPIPLVTTFRSSRPESPEAEEEARDPGWGARMLGAYVEAQVGQAGLGIMGLLFLVCGLVAVAIGIIGGTVMLLLYSLLPALVLFLLITLGFLSKVPWIGPKVRPFVTALSTTIGDAAVWTTAPLRADAMRDVVRERIEYARARARKVIVVAHSQGAVVAAKAIFDDPPAPVDVLVTVGGGTTLLRTPRWDLGEPDGESTLTRWAESGAATRWVNIWATLDPVPAGPVGVDKAAVKRRWNKVANASEEVLDELKKVLDAEGYEPIRQARSLANLTHADKGLLGLFSGNVKPSGLLPDPGEGDVQEPPVSVPPPPTVDELERLHHTAVVAAYRRATDPADAIGPEERPVDNELSLLTDHVRYAENIPEVIDPIAHIIYADENDETRLIDGPASRLVTSHRFGVTALALARFMCAIVAAAVTPILLRMLEPVPWIDTSVVALQLVNETLADIIAGLAEAGMVGILTAWLIGLLALAILQTLVTSLWRRYEYSRSWETRSVRLAAAAYFIVLGLLAAASWGSAAMWLSGGTPQRLGEALARSAESGGLTITIVLFVLLVVTTMLIPAMRVPLLPIPEKRSERAKGRT